MTTDLLVVLAILAVTIALFLSDRFRLDLIALLAVLGLMLSGVLTTDEALAGFSDNTVLIIAGLFVVGGGLLRTGVSPYTFMMTVAIAASTAFATPIASLVNTPVLGPGNYRFSDFTKLGDPLQLLILVATLAVVPILFPL
jgi:di/tricarboxylate transporter